MRVCLLGPAYPYRGGISHFTQMLAAGMQPDHETLIISFTRLYPGLLFPGRTQYEHEGWRVRVDSPRLIDSINPLSWRRAARAVIEFKPDLVVVQWWHPFFGPAFRAIVSAVQTSREGAVRVSLSQRAPARIQPARPLRGQWGLGTADACLVQSEEDRRKLQGILPDMPVAVHPHPMYTQFATGNMDARGSSPPARSGRTRAALLWTGASVQRTEDAAGRVRACGRQTGRDAARGR
jgi:hypothetical protein